MGGTVEHPFTPAEFRAMLDHAPILLDGALGTELERRGVACPAPLWSAGALLANQEVVTRIHQEYVRAGARILVANTFRTNVRTLRAAGLEARGAELNAAALALVRQACDAARGVLAAASIAPVEDCYRPDLVPEDAVLWKEHMQMVRWLRAGSPDLLWIETMNSAREAVAAARAVRASWDEWGEIPFVVSVMLREDGQLLCGDSFHEVAVEAEAMGATAVGVNCVPPRGLTELLPRLCGATSLPLVAYAHVGNEKPLAGWSYAQANVPPADYARYADRWVDAGARIVGGCCGTTPAYIAEIAARGGVGRD